MFCPLLIRAPLLRSVRSVLPLARVESVGGIVTRPWRSAPSVRPSAHPFDLICQANDCGIAAPGMSIVSPAI